MRPSKDLTWSRVARTIACRSTCLRRQVGCVLLDQRGHVLSTGYNGVAPGEAHCNEPLPMIVNPQIFPYACPGASAASGVNLDGCYAIHAEQNALLQCRDPWQIHTCYTTTSPCMTCVKLLLSTSCQRVVFIEEYLAQPQPKELWVKAGRSWDGVDVLHVAAV